MKRPALARDPEADPFGPWDFVEIWNPCAGHGDECMCPVCAGETPEDYGYDGDW